jgi:hypothetical protein
MRTIPKPDAAFLAFAKNILLQTQANAAAWNIAAAQAQELQELVDAADAAYEANQNLQTKNRNSTKLKQTSFADLKHFLSMFIGALKYNAAVSSEQLQAMGLPPREHHFHEPLPVPTETPELLVRAGVHGEITAYVDTPSFGRPDHAISRHEYHGFVLRWKFQDADGWQMQTSTRLHITLLFENEDTAKTLVLQAAWVNPRMQHGPWSKETTALVN